MKEGDEGRVVAGHDGDVGVQKSRNWIFIWAGVIVIVLVLLVVVVYFVFMSDSGGGNSEESLDGYLGTIKRCLEMDDMNSECRVLFVDYLYCDDLEDLKDKCLFNTAVYMQDYSLCGIISDSELKRRCENEVIIFGEEF